MAETIKDVISRHLPLSLRLERDEPLDFVEKKKDARTRLDALARWSGRATFIILVGILVEFAVLWIGTPPSPDKILASVANGLVGLGLFVEYLIILRAVAASREIQDEADQKFAEAVARAGEANQARERAVRVELRVAEADKKAQELEISLAEAQLKLQRHSNPRVPDQGKFLRALAGKSKPAKIDVLYSIDEADCSTLAAWIAKLLRDAGWPVDPEYPLVIPRSTNPNRTSAQMEGGQPWGITILGAELEKDARPTNALLDALFESLGSPILHTARSGKIPLDHLRVVVAPRP